MEVSHLAEDELNYELVLRNLNIKDHDRILKLQDIVAFEVTSRTSPPLESVRILRSSVEQELQECDKKLAEIATAIDNAAKDANKEMLVQGRSRLLHITARVMRLKRRAPELEAVKRLLNRTLEIAEHFSSARDPGGSEELLATQDVRRLRKSEQQYRCHSKGQ